MDLVNERVLSERMLGQTVLIRPHFEEVTAYVRRNVKLPYLDRGAGVLWLECAGAVPSLPHSNDGLAHAATVCLKLREMEFGGQWTVDLEQREMLLRTVYIMRDWTESERDLLIYEDELERLKTTLVGVPVKPISV